MSENARYGFGDAFYRGATCTAVISIGEGRERRLSIGFLAGQVLFSVTTCAGNWLGTYSSVPWRATPERGELLRERRSCCERDREEGELFVRFRKYARSIIPRLGPANFQRGGERLADFPLDGELSPGRERAP